MNDETRKKLEKLEQHLGPWEPTDRPDDVMLDIRMLEHGMLKNDWKTKEICVQDVADYLAHKTPDTGKRLDAKTLVERIRADDVVGRGTCSVIDECWSDEDLVARFSHFDNLDEAVHAAHRVHNALTSLADDIRNA